MDGKTRVCGLIANPVEHSMSPMMHNFFAQRTGVNLAYVPFKVEEDRVGDAAQAAALHQRFLAGFSCHAFLLSVDECRFPTDALDGLMVFRAVLLGRSLRAATYRVDVCPACSLPLSETGSAAKTDKGLFGMECGKEAVPAWSVSLGIGLAPYDDTFRRDMLEPRYRRLFQWLTQNAPSANVSMKG